MFITWKLYSRAQKAHTTNIISTNQYNINDKITEPFYSKVSLLSERVFIWKRGTEKKDYALPMGWYIISIERNFRFFYFCRQILWFLFHLLSKDFLAG